MREVGSIRDRKIGGPWNPILLAAQHPGRPPHSIPQLHGSRATHIQELQLLLHLALEHSHCLEEGWAHQALCLLLREGFPVQQLLLEVDKAEPGLGPGLGLVRASPQGLALPATICLPPISEIQGKPSRQWRSCIFMVRLLCPGVVCCPPPLISLIPPEVFLLAPF